MLESHTAPSFRRSTKAFNITTRRTQISLWVNPTGLISRAPSSSSYLWPFLGRAINALSDHCRRGARVSVAVSIVIASLAWSPCRSSGVLAAGSTVHFHAVQSCLPHGNPQFHPFADNALQIRIASPRDLAVQHVARQRDAFRHPHAGYILGLEAVVLGEARVV